MVVAIMEYYLKQVDRFSLAGTIGVPGCMFYMRRGLSGVVVHAVLKGSSQENQAEFPS